MKTAEVELSFHMSIDHQAGIYGLEIGNEVFKKNIYFV